MAEHTIGHEGLDYSSFTQCVLKIQSLETLNFIKKAKKVKTQKYWDFPMSGNTVVCLQTQLGPIIHHGQLCVDLIEGSPGDSKIQLLKVLNIGYS